MPDLHLPHITDALPDEGDLLGRKRLPAARLPERNMPRCRILEVLEQLVGVDTRPSGDGVREPAVLVQLELAVREVLAGQLEQDGDAYRVGYLVLRRVGQGPQGVGCRQGTEPGEGRVHGAEVARTGEEADVRLLR